MTNEHRVLIIGVGSIGERHLRCFGQTGRADLSFCEINDELRTVIADRYGVAHTFADFDDAVASHPDVAVICAPAHLHVPMATALADAGIHVLCEKPLSTTLDNVEELIATADRRNITAAVAYVHRCNPLIVQFKEAIDSGRFGRPVNLVHASGQHFPFYRPAYRDIYYKDHKTGGGAIQDSMTHMLNLGEWLVGPIDRLAADAAHLLLEGVEVEDTVHVLTRHGDLLGSYAHNQHQAPNESFYIVACERATACVEYHNHRWMWQEKPDENWHVEKLPPMQRDDIFIAQANMFLDAVEGKGPVRCTLAEGMQTLKVNLATLAAADGHTWQVIDR